VGHLVDGHFQSDKYRWCPRDFVPLKTTDKDAQPVLWAYAQVHRARDLEFSADLETALRVAGFDPDRGYVPAAALESQRDSLAMALRSVLVKVGVVRPDASCTGPDLLTAASHYVGEMPDGERT
jgi:hypothetical protein